MPFLTTEDTDNAIRKIAIDGPEIVLGRHPDCEIIIDEGAVSRRHARIFREGDSYLVEDLQSRNGTEVNNRAIHQPMRLFDGDQIGICDQFFTFHIDEVSGLSKPRITAVERGSKRSGDSVQFDDHSVDVGSFVAQLELSSHHSSIDQAFAITPQQRLNTVVNVSRALSKAVGMENICQQILQCLFQLFVQVDRGFVVLRDGKGNLNSVAVEVRNPQDDELIRVSRTIVDYVLEQKQAVLSADAGTDERFDMSQSVADFRIRSLMCAPLLNSDGNSVGVIELDTLRRTIGFSDQDLEILSVVAMQASLAIDNENLYHVAESQRKMERDLELAHEVQHGLLPHTRPQIPGYQFYDYYRPAQKVGGDYYDYVVLKDGRIAVIVADVVGHGIAAALMMAKLAAEVRFAIATEPNPAEAVANVNRAIGGLDLDRFVTLVVAMLDLTTDSVSIINAGHMQPIIRRADGTCSEPGSNFSSLPIGIDPDISFTPFATHLNSGDSVVLYTDGVSECADENEKMFGVSRVRELVEAVSSSAPAEIGGRIIREVKAYVGNAPQLDDICLVCFGKT